MIEAGYSRTHIDLARSIYKRSMLAPSIYMIANALHSIMNLMLCPFQDKNPGWLFLHSSMNMISLVIAGHEP